MQKSVAETGRLLVLEDCAARGSMGERLCADLECAGIAARVERCNLGEQFLPEGTVAQLWQRCGLDAGSVAARALRLVKNDG